MQILFFDSREEAIMLLREKEREYVIVDHSVKSGKGFESHDHPVQEWIILDKGDGPGCLVHIEGKPNGVTLSKNKATVAVVPAFTQHAFTALQDITYTVLRETAE